MKKGITPIISIIILLLITVALAGMAWSYLNLFVPQKSLTVADWYCTGNQATVIVKNNGQNPISLINTAGTTCRWNSLAVPPAGDIGGRSETCGEVLVTKVGDTMTNAGFALAAGSTTLDSLSTVAFKDTCGAGMASCEYRFLVEGGAVGSAKSFVNCPGT